MHVCKLWMSDMPTSNDRPDAAENHTISLEDQFSRTVEGLQYRKPRYLK